MRGVGASWNVLLVRNVCEREKEKSKVKESVRS